MPFFRTFAGEKSALCDTTRTKQASLTTTKTIVRAPIIIKNKAFDTKNNETMTHPRNNNNSGAAHGRQPNRRVARPGTHTSPRRQRHVAASASTGAAAAAANNNSNDDGTDDLFGPGGSVDMFLRDRPLDAEAQVAADQRDAAVHAEVVAEIRGQQADEREARTSQEVVVGPTRNPTQAPNAGEPGFRDNLAAAVADIEAAAPSVLRRGRRGAAGEAGEAHGSSTNVEEEIDPDAEEVQLEAMDADPEENEAQEMDADSDDRGDGNGDVPPPVLGRGDDDGEDETEVQFGAGANAVDGVADVEEAAEGQPESQEERDALVLEVERLRVNPNTRQSYDRANVHLAFYLMDNNFLDCIKESQRQIFVTADAKDKQKASTMKTPLPEKEQEEKVRD